MIWDNMSKLVNSLFFLRTDVSTLLNAISKFIAALWSNFIFGLVNLYDPSNESWNTPIIDALFAGLII